MGTVRAPCDYHDNPKIMYTLYLAGRRLEIMPHQFLEACWGGAFDSPCSICTMDFDIAKAPPVRLLRLHGSPDVIHYPSKNGLLPVIIVNAHLNCLELGKIKYFPISHAWHHPVAEAYESRNSNPAAASMVYEMPIRILMGVARRFGPDSYIWHDYVSIPQWQDEFRGAKILPQIFQIFQAGISSVIHLDERPAFQVQERYNSDDFALQSLELRRLFGARWFRRMWIVIEYDVCRDAHVMNSNYELMSSSLSTLTKRLQNCQADCRWGGTTVTPQTAESISQLLETIPMFLKEKVKVKCLGYIYDMISSQECRSHRDRFVATCALLNVNDHLLMISEMPQDPQEACAWISRRCLAGNDYSPLLLSPSLEGSYEVARWLRGHTVMSSKMWGLGTQTRAAQSPPRLRGDKLDLPLKQLGSVIKHATWRMGATNDTSYYGFAEALPHLIGFAAGSTTTFLRAIESIYPSKVFWAQRNDGTYDFPGLRYQVHLSEHREAQLQQVLQLYGDAESEEDRVAPDGLLSRHFISVLGLDEPPIEARGPFTMLPRLEFYGLICNSDEYNLLVVRCLTCGKDSLIRAALWGKPTSQTQVLQIPGLAYSMSVYDGMALIMDHGMIIGRVRFGPQTCGCGTTLTVELS
ncbi:hypothetical protein F4808DRAFT_365950 [Astrocystis sublimbata]|nr:hypothetical protein F4808DRAFT_365950 [Astrocystis sublimbata]